MTPHSSSPQSTQLPATAVPMLETLTYTSTPSTHFPLHTRRPSPFFRIIDWGSEPKPSHMQIYGREQRERDQQYPPQKLVSQWLASTAAAASTSGLSTPPREMSGGNVNAMLAPTYGGLYNHAANSKPSNPSYQTSIDFYGDRTLASTGKAFLPTSSNPPSPGPLKDTIGLYGNPSRRRSLSNGNLIAPYLQIPALINDSKGSLSEFAAQVSHAMEGSKEADPLIVRR